MDHQLQNKSQLTRKGKPHPLIDLRIRVAAHRRENYKLVGIKRRPPPEMTLQQYVAEKYGGNRNDDDDRDDPEQTREP